MSDSLKIMDEAIELIQSQAFTIQRYEQVLEMMRDCDVPFENDNSKFFECREAAMNVLPTEYCPCGNPVTGDYGICNSANCK